MAFQVGSQIRPELANADLSGFARAAEIQASTLAQLGAAIGGAIQDHQAKKAKKQEQQVTLNAIKSLYPDLDDDTAKAIATNKTVLDLFKTTLNQGTIKPSSPDAMAKAETYAAGLDFKFNRETGKMERVEGPGFLRSLGNILTPGQPFGSPKTVEMPQEVIEGTTGMQQFIQQQQALTGTNDVPEVDTNKLPDVDSDDPIELFK